MDEGNSIPLRPWERQPGETSKAYQARWLYISAGVDRTISDVARKLSKSAPMLRRWTIKHKWVESARAWDIEQDRVRVEQATRVMAEKARADAEKWARRSDKLPDMMFLVCADTFRDIQEANRNNRGDDPTKFVEIPHKGVLVRSFVATAPLAKEALEMIARRNAVKDATGATTPVPANATKGALEALRAYQKTQDALAPVDPEQIADMDDTGLE